MFKEGLVKEMGLQQEAFLGHLATLTDDTFAKTLTEFINSPNLSLSDLFAQSGTSNVEALLKFVKDSYLNSFKRATDAAHHGSASVRNRSSSFSGVPSTGAQRAGERRQRSRFLDSSQLSRLPPTSRASAEAPTPAPEEIALPPTPPQQMPVSALPTPPGSEEAALTSPKEEISTLPPPYTGPELERVEEQPRPYSRPQAPVVMTSGHDAEEISVPPPAPEEGEEEARIAALPPSVPSLESPLPQREENIIGPLFEVAEGSPRAAETAPLSPSANIRAEESVPRRLSTILEGNEEALYAQAETTLKEWVSEYAVAIKEAFKGATDPVGQALYKLVEDKDNKALMEDVLDSFSLEDPNHLQGELNGKLLEGFRALPQSDIQPTITITGEKAEARRYLLSLILKEKEAVKVAFADAEKDTPNAMAKEIAEGHLLPERLQALLAELVQGLPKEAPLENIEDQFYQELLRGLSGKAFYAPDLEESRPTQDITVDHARLSDSPDSVYDILTSTPIIPKRSLPTSISKQTPEELAFIQIQQFIRDNKDAIKEAQFDAGNMVGFYAKKIANGNGFDIIPQQIINELKAEGLTDLKPEAINERLKALLPKASS